MPVRRTTEVGKWPPLLPDRSHPRTCRGIFRPGWGLKATTPEEWTEQVLRLVGDAALRKRIGEAAREQVLAEHTIEARAPAWRAFVAEAAGR